MELAIVGVGIVAIVLLSKILAGIAKAAGALFLPMLLCVVTWFVIHNHVCAQTCAYILMAVFIISLIAMGKRK